MNSYQVMGMLERLGAVIINTHVVYSSGKHGSMYIDIDAIYPHTEEILRLCEEIALRFSFMERSGVEVVIGPANGGNILSEYTADRLSKIRNSKKVLHVCTEKKDGGNFIIRPGDESLVSGKEVLVVEDVLTTGGTAKKVVQLVRRHGGNVVGVGVLCNRGKVTREDLGYVPRLSELLKLPLEAYDASCPLSLSNIPINTDVGYGKEFLARKNAQNQSE